METNINRTALNISTYCNLKCKHCLAFTPYYKSCDRKNMTAEEAEKTLTEYFRVVDSVEHFTVTGGEPLLNPNTHDILALVYRHLNQIRGSVDFVTNGTLLIPDEILDLFEEHREHTRVVLSDYGKNLSVKLEEVRKSLEQRGIRYRISKFYGDNLYYDGWIDFTDHSQKWFTQEERDANARKCIHRVGKYFVINDGELHCCSRSFWRIKNHIIPKIEGEFVPLTDDGVPLEKKRQLLMTMYQMDSSTSCAYCVGLCNGVPRVRPAQQLD